MSVYFETLDTIHIDIDWLCIDSIDHMYLIVSGILLVQEIIH